MSVVVDGVVVVGVCVVVVVVVVVITLVVSYPIRNTMLIYPNDYLSEPSSHFRQCEDRRPNVATSLHAPRQRLRSSPGCTPRGNISEGPLGQALAKL